MNKYNTWTSIIRGMYLKYMIKRTEKRLCKYVSKLLNKNVASVSGYVES